MNYKVLFQTCPVWKPGEVDTDAIARRIIQEDIADAERYPNDYAGRVISLIPSTDAFTPSDVADPSRTVITCDLSPEQVLGLRARTLKIDSDEESLIDVTFDDRWGAIAPTLRANIEDYETAEAEAAQDPNTSIDARRFTDISGLAWDQLPPVEVNTGAGLYEVGPAQTYSTIQSALDQLWIDQGSVPFSAPQTIRIFASTYTENVAISPSFKPELKNYLRLEANGSDSVTIDGTAASCITSLAFGGMRFERLIFESTGGYGIAPTGSFFNTQSLVVRDCTFNSYNGMGGGFELQGTTLIEDCIFTGSNWGVASTRHMLTIRRCRFHDQVHGIDMNAQSVVIEACVFDTCTQAIYGQDAPYSGVILRISNCVFYGCTDDIYMPWAGTYTAAMMDLVSINNIHMNSGRCYYIPAATQLSLVNYNCIYNATIVATVDTTDKTTFAEWQAYADEWGNSPEAESLAVDPLFTNPALDDFSLQTTSPCIHAGHGSGAVSGYLGTAFDPNNPDIGSWSSGSFDIPNAPTITAMVNDGDGTSATASVLTDSGSKVFVLSRRRNSAEAWTVYGSRTDSGDIVATGFTNNANYESIAIATFGTLVTEKPSLPSIPVGVYITDETGLFATIRQALYDWVSGELGIPAIWYQPNAPQPVRPYVALNMGPTQSPRWDFHSPPDAVSGVSTLRGDREFTLEIQIHHKAMPGYQNPAYSLAEQLSTSLQKVSIVELFNAADFAFVDRVALTDLSAIGGTEFEARASLDLLFRMAHEATDAVGVIETVDAVGATLE